MEVDDKYKKIHLLFTAELTRGINLPNKKYNFEYDLFLNGSYLCTVYINETESLEEVKESIAQTVSELVDQGFGPFDEDGIDSYDIN